MKRAEYEKELKKLYSKAIADHDYRLAVEILEKSAHLDIDYISELVPEANTTGSYGCIKKPCTQL